MLRVPGGTFFMGADFDEYIDEEVREYPKRAIELSALDKVIRGGGVFIDAGWPRCCYREYFSPEWIYTNIGFRVVKNLEI